MDVLLELWLGAVSVCFTNGKCLRWYPEKHSQCQVASGIRKGFEVQASQCFFHSVSQMNMAGEALLHLLGEGKWQTYSLWKTETWDVPYLLKRIQNNKLFLKSSLANLLGGTCRTIMLCLILPNQTEILDWDVWNTSLPFWHVTKLQLCTSTAGSLKTLILRGTHARPFELLFSPTLRNTHMENSYCVFIFPVWFH